MMIILPDLNIKLRRRWKLQDPFFCPFVAVVLALGLLLISELNILLYIPLIAGTVTLCRGQ